ncbi:PrsW family intramembrane metalloprotease [Ornithinimicrobium sp. F0845]|uniref:PrsW family intramembrane metalloprotease n=1 Tax=Ornithinimicrobium sp. F0845 TaxID=2926412 RepID=UPI001FF118DE|nr:PrsW family intramembrane metalloprotease [Ornithinimicrobium sp. F0845]MCK0111628.1 PrsW family intramembrane metalloprotease [Ornithinimicrobium sp. F0845]
MSHQPQQPPAGYQGGPHVAPHGGPVPPQPVGYQWGPAQPQLAPPAPPPGVAHGPYAGFLGEPANATPRRTLRRFMVWSGAVTLFGLCGLFMSVLVTESTGATAALLGLLTASIALGIVVPVLLWVDRLEAEPARTMWFAFLWGALVSTAGALLLNDIGMAFFAGLHLDPVFTGAVLVAPVVEEALKCLGVLVIFLVARREFNGVVDGIVYAGMVAVGFAFIENIIYLGGAYNELGAPGLLGIFVMRVLVSPFAHPMFTICFGIALGMITHRRRWRYAFIPLIGFVAAVFLHFLWNFAALSTIDGFLLAYVLVQVPLFIGFVLLLFYSRRQESRMLREHLTGYGLNGWFTPAEVAMLISPRERRRARAWAKGVGGTRAEQAMEAFQDESSELAIARHHLERGDPDPVWRHRERALLHTVQARRATFAAPLQTPQPYAAAQRIVPVPHKL